MDLSKILAIGGKPGLYRMLGQTKSGFIVESLLDGRRMPAFPSQQVSTLEEISIYTTGDDLPLKEVIKRIYDHESGGEAPDHKGDSALLISYFETIIPEYDQELVRQSDIRKVYRWYNELLAAGLVVWNDEETLEGSPDESQTDLETDDTPVVQ